MKKDEHNTTPPRRTFLRQAGALTAAALLPASMGAQSITAQESRASLPNAPRDETRRERAARVRTETAATNLQNTPPALAHPNNGDETLYPNRIASYSKGLPHEKNGEVVAAAYNAFLAALNSGRHQDFEALTLGGTRALTNPQGGLTLEMEGADAHSFVQPPPPAFASREMAAEIAENYWMALLRDVPFNQYSSNALAAAAAADLTLFGADFKGPKNGNTVTPDLLFRGLTPGDRVGPYFSQYFHLECPFGANPLNQKILSAVPNVNFVTTFADWLAVQRGFVPGPALASETTARYLRNGRDISTWVHIDVLFQGYFQAFLVLAALGAPLDAGNPYANSTKQMGFASFGGPHIATLLCEVSTRALHAVWFQKWFVHRRLRPEAFAGRIHARLYLDESYPVHKEILNSLNSTARLGGYYPGGNALLPQAFPEGSPTHPAYGAGHATVAGACVTILKAWFNETTPLTSLIQPVQPAADGLTLTPYNGSDAGSMTVGGELNKIASNVAVGRNIAGVHWRSDATNSILLGESVALAVLQELRATYNEPFNGFSLTKFDGTNVTV